jgi:putative oxidoreductase
MQRVFSPSKDAIRLKEREHMDTGLLLVRLVIGVLLIGHGTQKLFGWFGGYGLEGTGGFFHSLGFRPGRVMAAVAGLSEAGGGLLLALGLLTPLAGAALVGTLLVAASVHVEKGLWGTNGGYEMALVYGVLAAAVALSGPGSVSLDRAFGIDDSWSVGLGLAAIAIGLLSGAAVIARAKWNLRQDAVTTKSEAGSGAHATAA